jgi:hypothetical protein
VCSSESITPRPSPSAAFTTTAAPASPKRTTRCRNFVFQANSSGVGGTSAAPYM